MWLSVFGLSCCCSSVLKLTLSRETLLVLAYLIHKTVGWDAAPLECRHDRCRRKVHMHDMHSSNASVCHMHCYVEYLFWSSGLQVIIADCRQMPTHALCFSGVDQPISSCVCASLAKSSLHLLVSIRDVLKSCVVGVTVHTRLEIRSR